MEIKLLDLTSVRIHKQTTSSGEIDVSARARDKRGHFHIIFCGILYAPLLLGHVKIIFVIILKSTYPFQLIEFIVTKNVKNVL